jgi:selenocysteine lyase/cysteine desulfurase
MAPPWDEIRRDFPAVLRHVYLNAAAAGPTPRPVREAVTQFLREMEEDGDIYWESWIEHSEAVRARVAGLIGAQADEIAFVPNTSTGVNLIVDMLGDDGAVLSSELEFPGVTLPWIHRGIPVHLLPAVEGIVRLESFALAGAPRAATIALSHVEFSNGCRQDLEALGRLKGHRNLVVSGSQSVGAFPVDVRRCHVDALACAGHKWLCAGYGAGFLYVSRELLARRPPRMVGWLSVEHPFAFDNRRVRLLSTSRRHELGCPSFAPIFALGAAVEYLGGIGIDAIAARILELNMYLTARLEREGFELLSPGGEHRSGQTLVALADPRQAAEYLNERGILITRKREGVRIATHFFNNEEDIEACVAALVDHRDALGSSG